MLNLKNTKKFEGNDHGARYGLYPIERGLTVDDIPSLPPERVKVMAYIGSNVGQVTRKKRVVICKLSDLPDNPRKAEDYIYELIQKAQAQADEDLEEEEKVTVGRTLDEAIEEYLKKAVPKLKDACGYQKMLRFWSGELGSKRLVDIKRLDVKDALGTLGFDAGIIKAATYNNYRQALKSCLNYIIEELEWMDDDFSFGFIWEKVKAKPKNNEIVRFLTDDERERLFKSISESTSEGLHDFVHFALNTGCRWGEARGLSWKNIDFEKEVITFAEVLAYRSCTGTEEVDGKTVLKLDKNVIRSGLKNGDASRTLSLKPYPELKQWLLDRKKRQMVSGHADRVFPTTPKTAWRNALKRAGITNFRIHDLRHTCCSDLAMAGESLLKIGRHVGHKNPASTKRYTHFNTQATEETGAILQNKYYKNVQ